MPNATIPSGILNEIENCYISVPGYGPIKLNNLPEISDSKSAVYNDEPVPGRTMPLKTYSHSDNRTISMSLHFFVVKKEDIEDIIYKIRALESAVYPRKGDGSAPFYPPPICQVKCGRILSEQEICVILRSYSTRWPTDVAWDKESLVPFRVDIDLSWETVYASDELPNQDTILNLGA